MSNKLQVQFTQNGQTLCASVAVTRDRRANYVRCMWFSDTQEPFHVSEKGYVQAYHAAMAMAQSHLIG